MGHVDEYATSEKIQFVSSDEPLGPLRQGTDENEVVISRDHLVVVWALKESSRIVETAVKICLVSIGFFPGRHTTRPSKCQANRPRKSRSLYPGLFSVDPIPHLPGLLSIAYGRHRSNARMCASACSTLGPRESPSCSSGRFRVLGSRHDLGNRSPQRGGVSTRILDDIERSVVYHLRYEPCGLR